MIALRPLFLHAGLALAAAFWTFPAAAAPLPPVLDFTVIRGGEEVGSHVLRFDPTPDGLKVAVDTHVVVKMAMIPVYRFEHHDEETWRDGHLVTLNSATNDDGTHHGVKVSMAGESLRVQGDGGDAQVPAATVPASLWNRATIAQTGLMNTLDGHVMSVAVADLGREPIRVHGTERPAHHYALTGDLNRELWYDDDGVLVQVRFKAKDDSDIRYVLK